MAEEVVQYSKCIWREIVERQSRVDWSVTFHIDVGGHLYIEESIYSMEILTYPPILGEIRWRTLLSQSLYDKK